MTHDFFFPGKFIGVSGATIKSLKQSSDCIIVLKNSPSVIAAQQQQKKNGGGKNNNGGSNSKSWRNHHDTLGDPDEKQVCVLEGTRANIERCLANIRDRFVVF